MTAPAVTTPLAVLLGHRGAYDAVHVRLDAHRPHVRWAAPIGYGKSTALRVAVTELATQIPDTGHPRMFLFETDRPPNTFGGLQQLPGITVFAHEHQAAGVKDVQAELDRRIADEDTAPLVIAADEYFRASPELQDLVISIENDELPGVHLALVSSSLGDYKHRADYLVRADYFKELVRQQIYSGPEHPRRENGWNELVYRARLIGIGWRPPQSADQDVIMNGIGVPDSDIRFGIWQFTSRLDKYMYYDLLPHPDKYTTIVLRARQRPSEYMPFVANYPELDYGDVAFAATSGSVTAFIPTPVEVRQQPYWLPEMQQLEQDSGT